MSDVLQVRDLTVGILKGAPISMAITADVGSAQGGSPLVSTFNLITVCANAGDSVTLPAVANVGTIIFIKNSGAESCDVFPASGDDLGAGANTAAALAAAASIIYVCVAESATWEAFLTGA